MIWQLIRILGGHIEHGATIVTIALAGETTPMQRWSLVNRSGQNLCKPRQCELWLCNLRLDFLRLDFLKETFLHHTQRIEM